MVVAVRVPSIVSVGATPNSPSTLTAEDAGPEGIDRFNLTGLYIACGCQLGDARAVHAFRERYLPVIERKPGALRHGAPFVQWDLPVPIKVVRDRILKQDKGDRAFVELLLMARTLGDSGLETLEVACELTLQSGVICAALVVNAMQRLTEASRPKKCMPS